MTPTVQWLYDWLDSSAPFACAEDFDNVGLLTGAMAQPITGIITALDCTPAVILEAKAHHANVILTHHPLMFSPRQNLREDDWEGQILCTLVRNHIALISAHTNLDKAIGGVNDVLAKVLNLAHVQGDNYVRLGTLPHTMTAQALALYCEAKLQAPVRLYGDPMAFITCLGVGSGAGSDGWADAKASGAQGYLTGEVKHHHIIEATGCGMVLLDAGHYATEAPAMITLTQSLQNIINTLQLSVNVYHSDSIPYIGAVKQHP